MTTIRYFIPEDGDDEDYPNIFLMPKQQGHTGFSPKLKEVKEAFPMPGNYHFRFKSPLIPGTDREKGAVAVWMDCIDDHQHVGVWRNSIVAKVTRINMDDDDHEGEEQEFSTYNANGHGHAPVPSQQHQQQTAAPMPSRSTRTAPPPTSTQQQPEGDILGVFDETVPPTPATGNLLEQPPSNNMTHGEASLLDMTGGSYNHHDLHNGGVTNSNHHNDFMGMTATPAPAPPVPPVVPAAATQIPAPPTTTTTTSSAPTSGSYGVGSAVPQKIQPPRSGNAAGLSLNNSGPFGGLNWD